MISANTYKVLGREKLSQHTFLLYTERPNVPVKAGQCFSVGTAELGINREYSIYSGADDPFLTFLIRELEDGIVSSALGACDQGSVVEIGGPYGDFCLSTQHIQQNEFIFIATGTGIAPFHSFVKTYPELNYLLLHGIRHAEEAYENQHYKADGYVACMSQPINLDESLRVTDWLQQHPIATDVIYYLCGNRKMITDVTPMLLGAGVSGDNIFIETFF